MWFSLVGVIKVGFYFFGIFLVKKKQRVTFVFFLLFTYLRNVEDVKDQAKIGHGHGKI